ncbi:hypothetical protein SAMN04488505_103338 [Chitinophaga rupis]|uniref:Uncharacterized protein n=1 Tax=Chitinophaga rupis TaxID=573321 RepID=A0A1H7VIV6_9BACT|nr:hypothetical protein SAMN04488505_103338 [Chitinophaga rupis]
MHLTCFAYYIGQFYKRLQPAFGIWQITFPRKMALRST